MIRFSYYDFLHMFTGRMGHRLTVLIFCTTTYVFGQPVQQIEVQTPVEYCESCQGQHGEHLGLAEMAGFYFANLFNTESYPPRWRCGEWTTLEGWTSIISDLFIWIAYMAIPLLLIVLLKRHKAPESYRLLLIMFAAFIIFCGFTHLMDAIIFWWPAYRLQTLLKFFTAAVSIATVCLFAPKMSTLLSVKSREVLHQEVAERIQTQQLLKHSEQQHRLLLNYVSDLTWSMNSEGHFVTDQPAWETFTGQTRKTYEGFGWINAFHPDSRASLQDFGKFHQNQLKPGTPWLLWSQLKNEYRHVMLYIVEIPDKEGKNMLFGAVVDIHDELLAIQRRNLLVQKLKENKKELERIIYVTSHDLRSPLVNIQGFCEEVRLSTRELAGFLQIEDLPENAKQVLESEIPFSLDYIQNSVNKMDQLLKSLLLFSRLGRVEMNIQELDMNRITDDVIATFEYTMHKGGHQVTREDLLPCQADEVQMNQALTNLIGNALKYLRPNVPAEIRIQSRREDGHIVYSVHDNGMGIEPNHLKQVFEIFHRLHPTQFEGEGVGLSLVQVIARRHEGRVWVESEPGKGSTFYLSIPEEPSDLVQPDQNGAEA